MRGHQTVWHGLLWYILTWHDKRWETGYQRTWYTGCPKKCPHLPLPAIWPQRQIFKICWCQIVAKRLKFLWQSSIFITSSKSELINPLSFQAQNQQYPPYNVGKMISGGIRKVFHTSDLTIGIFFVSFLIFHMNFHINLIPKPCLTKITSRIARISLFPAPNCLFSVMVNFSCWQIILNRQNSLLPLLFDQKQGIWTSQPQIRLFWNIFDHSMHGFHLFQAIFHYEAFET